MINPAVARSLAGAVPRSFWLDQPGAPDPADALAGPAAADLAVIGGGFTGLWTALLARERYPGLDVVLLEAKTVGWAASGRNGGFCSASLTHGIGNGLERFGGEMPLLEKLGQENLREIGATVAAHGIDCDFQPTGELALATAQWQLDGLDEEAVAARRLGHDVAVLDGAAGARAELNSPRWAGGLRYATGNAMVEPGRLAWGLRRACLDAGVRIFEHTPVTSLSQDAAGAGLLLRTPYGSVRAGRVALAAGVPGASLLRRVGLYLVPVWDYVLMTEPLSAAQLAALGWRDRRGASDLGNQFHYFRLTRDNRVLWGGYDAVYYNGGRIREEHGSRPATYLKLAEHFFATFPQLEGVSFTHAWGGVIDTCSRFCAFFGSARGGRVAYAAGYTGLGVGATRFAAQVLLDKLHNEDTERVRTSLVTTKPVPFPPEPLRSGVIQATRASIARADRNSGRRDLWLRTLDRLGLGFDSLSPGGMTPPGTPPITGESLPRCPRAGLRPGRRLRRRVRSGWLPLAVRCRLGRLSAGSPFPSLPLLVRWPSRGGGMFAGPRNRAPRVPGNDLTMVAQTRKVLLAPRGRERRKAGPDPGSHQQPASTEFRVRATPLRKGHKLMAR